MGILLAICISLAASAAAPGGELYRAEMVDAFASEPLYTDVNEAGQVVGAIPGSGSPMSHAAIYTPGVGIQDLGTIGGTVYGTEGTALNNVGGVAGIAWYPHGEGIGGRTFPVKWTPEGGWADLSVGADTGGLTLDINDSGQIVGVTGDLAALWQSDGARVDLGTLGGSTSCAQAINASGQVVGSADLAGDDSRAFLWTAGGGMQDLGTLGGDDSHGMGVNDAGDVVGYSENAAGETRAFLRTGGALQDLGTVDASSSNYRAYAINDGGMVVGRYTNGYGTYEAFLWTAQTGMLRLDDMIPGWYGHCDVACSINEDGQIVGRSTTGSVYLGTPLLRWQSASGGNWDTGDWSWGLTPKAIYPVSISAAEDPITVVGPSADTTVGELNVGHSGSAAAELVLRGGVTLTVDPSANPGANDGDVSIGGLGVLRTPAASLDAELIVVTGQLIFDEPSAGTFGGTVHGPGTLTKTGAGTLTLTGTCVIYGGSHLNGGTLAVSRDDLLGRNDNVVHVGGGALRITDTAFTGTSRSFVIGGAGGTIDVPAAGQTFALAADGSLSGCGNLTKTGPGTLALWTVDNTHTGDVIVSAGTLEAVGGSLPADVVNDAAVVFVDSADGTYSGDISGGGSVTKEGGGVLTLTGSHTYTGATLVRGGSIRAGADHVLSDRSVVALSAGTGLALAGFADTIGALSGAGWVDLGGGALTVGGGDCGGVFSGAIGGAGSLTKTGSGTQTLTGDNTHTGGTHFNGGVLAVSDGGSLGDPAGGLSFDGGTLGATASFALDRDATLLGGGGGIQTADGTVLTYAGAIGGDGALTHLGPGTLVLTGTNTYTGGTRLLGGTLAVADDAALAHAAGALSFDGGTLRTTASFATARPATIGTAGGWIHTDTDTTLTWAGSVDGPGGLTKRGAGTLLLTGPATYAGATDVEAGTLRLGASDRLADQTAVTLSPGATLDLDGFDESIGSLSGGGAVLLGAGRLAVGANGASTTFGGVVTGDGGLTKIGGGTLTLTGPNDYAGGTVVSSGTLLGTTDSLRGDILNDARVAFDQDFDGSYTGRMTGAGGLVKLASGALALTGTNDHAGGTFIRGGTVAADRDANLGLAAGPLSLDGGTLRATGTFSMGRGTTLGPGGGTIETDAPLTMSGDLSGPGGLTKTGPSVLTLTGLNRYTGGTIVASGTLAGTTDALRGAIFNASAVVFDQGFDGLHAGVMTGPGTLTKTGAGEVALGAANGYSGGTWLREGVLSVPADGCFGTPTAPLTFDGGTLRATGAFTTARDALLLTGGGTLATDADLTYAGAAAGAGDLVKSGAGTLIVTGTLGHTGRTLIDAGTVRLGSPERIADASSVTVAAGAVLNLNGCAETLGSLAGSGSVVLGSASLTLGADDTDAAFAGAIDGAGGLVKIGSAEQTLSGASGYTGGTALRGGTLAVGADAGLGAASGGLAFHDAATLRVTDSFATARGVTLNAGGGTIEVDDGATLAANGTILGTGSLVKTGAGRLTLSQGGNDYAGGTHLLGGDVEVANDNRLGAAGAPLVFDGGVLRVVGTAYKTTARPIVWNDGGFDIDAAGNTFTLDQDLSGTGELRKYGDGLLWLKGNKSYAGDTLLFGGRIRYGDGTHDNGGTIVVQDGCVLELDAGTTIRDGGLVTLGTGAVRSIYAAGGNNAPVLEDLTATALIEVPTGKQLTLAGEIVNNDSIQVQAAGLYTYLNVRGDAMLGGSGAVSMTSHSYNRLRGEGDNRLTQQAGHTICGGGQLGCDSLAFTNHGVVQADTSAALVVDPLDGPDGFVNTATLRAADGGTLRLTGGQFANAGGVVEALTGSAVELATGAALTGGCLRTGGTGVIRAAYPAGGSTASAPTLTDVTNTGLLEVPTGQQLALAGAIANTGTITVGGTTAYHSDLRISGEVLLDGAGRVVVSDSSGTHVRGDGDPGADRLTLSASQVLTGAGHLGYGEMDALTNHGLIEATGTCPLTVDLAGTAGMTNDGVLRAAGAGGLDFDDATFTNAGVVEVLPGSRLSFEDNYVQAAGSTRVDGLMESDGSAQVHVSGGVLTGAGTIEGDVSLIDAGAAAPGDSVGVLTIDGDLTFAGGSLVVEVAAHSPTPGVGHDQLVVTGDLLDIDTARLTLVLTAPSVDLNGSGLAGVDMTLIDGGGVVSGTGPGGISAAGYWAVDPVAAVEVVGSDVTLRGSSLSWTAHDGDATLDDAVDVFDLAVLGNHYGDTGNVDWTDADFNCDGTVDVFDLAVLGNNYGWSAGGDAIPEPTGMAMLAVGAAALIHRRRGRRVPA